MGLSKDVVTKVGLSGLMGGLRDFGVSALKKIATKFGFSGLVGAAVGFGAALLSVHSGWEALVGIGTVLTAAGVGLLTGVGTKMGIEFGLSCAPRIMKHFRDLRDFLFHRNRNHMQEDLQQRQVQPRAPVPQASVMPESKTVENHQNPREVVAQRMGTERE